MKKLFKISLILFVMLVTVASCSKNSDIDLTTNDDPLVYGTWESEVVNDKFMYEYNFNTNHTFTQRVIRLSTNTTIKNVKGNWYLKDRVVHIKGSNITLEMKQNNSYSMRRTDGIYFYKTYN